MKLPIYVTQPKLPNFEDFTASMQFIWDKKILTNNGELHQELEKSLCEYLDVPYISLFNNGTIALMVALQALNLKKGGEVITTPYTFVATAHSVIWNDLKPVFVDIQSSSPNICPDAIEKAITENTVAIMPVHCYGIPCDIQRLQEISEKYQLPIIYDSAHAFGIKINGQSILNYGDLSVLSFHATKVFNTFEGGAIVCHTPEMKKRIEQLKNFGLDDTLDVIDFGLNGKMNEIQALMGLHQLKQIDENLLLRRTIDKKYRQAFQDKSGIECLSRDNIERDNYSYFPIRVTQDFHLSRDEFFNRLVDKKIITRKYFYPLISEMTAYKNYYRDTPNAYALSQEILCLPMYPSLSDEELDYIIDVILAM